MPSETSSIESGHHVETHRHRSLFDAAVKQRGESSGVKGKEQSGLHLDGSDGEEPVYEVVIPVEEDFVGHLDAEELMENVNMDTEDSDQPLRVDSASERGEKFASSLIFYTQNQPTFHAETLADLKGSSILQNIETVTFWLDVWGYDLHTLSVLAKIFGIHPLTVEDIWDEEHREKCELYEDYTFVCIRVLLERNEETGSHVDYGVVYLICTEKYVISFHLDKLPRFSNIYTRLDKLSSISLTPGWILYTILDNIVDGFIPVVAMMEMECDSIDELALLFSQQSQNEILSRIAHARKTVTILLRLVSHKADVFKMIQSRSQKFTRVLFQKDVLLYLDDIHSHVVSMEQTLQQMAEALNRAHGAYLAQISVELTQASNRMGMTMKKFTAGACIFLPLTLISGLLGVNMQVPFQVGGPNDEPYWFYILVVLMGLLAITLVLIGRRLHWFD